jgi:hypothetical protein
MSKTPAQLQREIDGSLGPVKCKRKTKSVARPTERERLQDLVNDQAARVRTSFKAHWPDLQDQQNTLSQLRLQLGRCIALDLGHSPTVQKHSFECFACPAYGSIDVHPQGTIFTEACTGPKAAAQIAYRAKP